MSTSNKFTLTRIILAPVIFLLFMLPKLLSMPDRSIWCVVSAVAVFPLLAIAEITDYFDGHYARKLGQVSDFGKMFDPFADVFLHLSMFALFAVSGRMPLLCFVLILYREFAQSFLRMVSAKEGVAIAARKGGKVKTVFYVASCFVALITETLARVQTAGVLADQASTFAALMRALSLSSNVLFVVCTVLAYVSFIDYIKNFGGVFKRLM